ncbi:LysE family translocator [Burkholderia cenocepacia]|uniref:LysE family translocator n=1 Tax=Burkholderia cenocepacia TaxID=95486 RepID=UPI002652607E|nr:LysE family transporter [Burkholderia cenocepacia]MDN7452505.1 LysE family transporter [Burkholderia cenocepacia]
MVALGIASPHAVWAAMAIFGLGLIVAKLAWLYEAIRIAGAAYLIYLGIKTLSGLRQSTQQAESASQPIVRGGVHAYRKGLLLGLTNPKAAAFFDSLFVTLLPAHAPRGCTARRCRSCPRLLCHIPFGIRCSGRGPAASAYRCPYWYPHQLLQG